MITASIIGLAFINIFACLAIELECESHGAAAVDSCGCVLAGAVAAAVVHRARFWTMDTAQLSSGKLSRHQQTSWVQGMVPGTLLLKHLACLSHFQVFVETLPTKILFSGYSICVLNTNPRSLMMSLLLLVTFLMPTLNPG